MSDDRCSPTRKRASWRTLDVSAPHASEGADLAVRISEGDLRIVDAYYYELALEASQDRSPPTPEDQVELAKLTASSERLKSMTREERLALRAHRLRHGALRMAGHRQHRRLE